MTNWQELCESVESDPILEKLNESQLEAIVSLMALTIFADDRVVPLEAAAFNEVMFRLPGLRESPTRVRKMTAKATERVESATTEEDLLKIAEQGANDLSGETLRAKVFDMALNLAQVDNAVHPAERTALKLIARALGIDESRLASL